MCSISVDRDRLLSDEEMPGVTTVCSRVLCMCLSVGGVAVALRIYVRQILCRPCPGAISMSRWGVSTSVVSILFSPHTLDRDSCRALVSCWWGNEREGRYWFSAVVLYSYYSLNVVFTRAWRSTAHRWGVMYRVDSSSEFRYWCVQ